MLSIFDQRKKTANSHVLNIKEEDFPEKYRPIIRRLQRAAVEPEVRDSMDIEDEITNEFKRMVRTMYLQHEYLLESETVLEEKDKIIEENKVAITGKDKALAEKEKALGEKDKAIAENKSIIAEKDKALEEKDKRIRELLQRLGE
jgi:uncharacterized protein (DUF3084 family)